MYIWVMDGYGWLWMVMVCYGHLTIVIVGNHDICHCNICCEWRYDHLPVKEEIPANF